MTIDTGTVLELAKWITALGVIWGLVRKIVSPLQAMNTAITLMQRERLESAHAVYCLVLGWCPSGEKQVLADIYRHYKQGGHNHMAEDYIEKICELPDNPKRQPGEGAILMQHTML